MLSIRLKNITAGTIDVPPQTGPGKMLDSDEAPGYQADPNACNSNSRRGIAAGGRPGSITSALEYHKRYVLSRR